MRNILLTVSYDGTNFCGWQRQDKSDGGKPVRTVQGEIEKVLEKIHKVKTPLQGSGRTDSGVHAVRQAANFFSPVGSIPAEKYVLAMNSLLPDDIRILEAKEVDEKFSSRFSATSRSYRYFIIPSHKALASQMPFAWDIGHEPDIDKLNKMASCLKGEIDCATFAASGDESVSTNRYIEDAFFFIQKDIWGNNLLVFQIEANAFLWKMVRTLTGTLVNLDKNNKPLDSMQKILNSKDRTKAGVTAPPSGLFLYDIKFDGIRRHI